MTLSSEYRSVARPCRSPRPFTIDMVPTATVAMRNNNLVLHSPDECQPLVNMEYFIEGNQKEEREVLQRSAAY
ncbi:hypothetical protein CLIM01_02383 [Colletotrichum limetticola]|uniref:Uncharacterized protein n=1 Tax=Colletotrichum limetticola TaxID=1209924 RepID=A0ABQ9Q8W2_9PEZI|nr:hypothetical protein CLIM01_02383 [Colletotrichum limetticola]